MKAGDFIGRERESDRPIIIVYSSCVYCYGDHCSQYLHVYNHNKLTIHYTSYIYIDFLIFILIHLFITSTTGSANSITVPTSTTTNTTNSTDISISTIPATTADTTTTTTNIITLCNFIKKNTINKRNYNLSFYKTY